MPSIRYVNQTAPFWDFVASLENQGPSHPFAGPSTENRESSDEEGGPRGSWGRGPWMGPGGPRGWHRGPPGPWGRHGHGPHPHPEGGHPPPPHHGGPPPPHSPHHEGHHPPPPPPPGSNPEDPAEQSPQEGEPRHDGPPHPHHHQHHGRRGGHCGRRGGGRPGSWGRGGPWGGGPWSQGPFGFGGGASGLADLAEAFQKQLFGNSNNDDNDNEERENTQGDFKPEADVFDTESAYVIHVSLPGAKKEDVGVSWDAEKSEISISGVVHRPGDEEFIKTLALNERKVGPFERKIRLGSRANPAQVDDDAITAKLEDGILRVEVPKLDKDYVEIKKVDIL
ncbi:hypothetical protein SLS55_005448 [Diplodia seriata]|uniref:SHSP domain-containing protein n=1 Tax=Diplodia seriata TaxID=420778 RepID=A0ABR3CGF1_9PEZI